jgi:hypothetical protein
LIEKGDKSPFLEAVDEANGESSRTPMTPGRSAECQYISCRRPLAEGVDDVLAERAFAIRAV